MAHPLRLLGPRLVTLLATVSLALPALAQADPDRLEEALEEPGADETVDDTRPPLPAEPDTAELRALVQQEPAEARPVLRRAARTAREPDARAMALLVLARIDPTRATARICSRALRIDPVPLVRRAAAECLGRLPSASAAPQTPALVAALDDEALDVLTMVGWALANSGDPAAIGPVTAGIEHPDPRVSRLFFEYTQRLRSRHGAPLDEAVPEGAARLVPAPDAIISQGGGLETTASTGWLALYGGMSGWLHGGFFPAAHGGPGLQSVAALSSLGGAVAGAAAGGAYGFFRADRLVLAQNVVQLGTFGTIAGYGAGLLSGPGPQMGINMASFGASGALVGTGVAVAMNEVMAPTPGALTLGVATGMGAAMTTGALALGYSLEVDAVIGSVLFMGGATGALTTLVMAPYDVGLLPIVGASLGGISFATVSALTLGIVESVQLRNADQIYTPGAGWAVAGSYALGAVTGAGLALLAPPELDPFLATDLRLNPPAVVVLPDTLNPRRTITLAQLGGTF